MCHDTDSRPPSPPADAVRDPRDLDSSGEFELTSADGTVLTAYEAIPTGEPRARVVVLPDVRGLHPYYRALAEQMAEVGLYTVAVDWFGRTAGDEPRGEDFDHMQHVQKVTTENVTDDVAAAVRHLSPEGTRPVFTLGFCFGGGHSWRLATAGLGLAGSIGFYGRPSLVEEALDDGDAAGLAPVLMLVAGADRATPVEDSLAAAERLRAAGAKVQTHVFDGAPHSFFDRSFAEHAPACDEAWRQVLGFVERHSRRH